MILFLAYFNRSHQEIFSETIYDIDWDNDDVEGYYESDEYKLQVDELKTTIMKQYYGIEYDIDDFDEFFEYNVWAIPR